MLIYNYHHFTGLSIRYVSDSTDKDPLGGSTDKERRGTLVTRPALVTYLRGAQNKSNEGMSQTTKLLTEVA